jgi:hypothetical protein
LLPASHLLVPFSTFRRFLCFLSCSLAVCVIAPNARADVEMGVAAGSAVYASSWRGDYGAGATLRAGVRFAHVFAVDFQAWESYATVNERLNTGLSLGVTGYLPLRLVHPYARLFAMHQHEEGLVSVENTPAGTLFGIGAGIRHRAAGGLSLGAEVPFATTNEKRMAWLFFADVTATYFPDDTLGPHTYVGLNLGFGLDYLLR